jgi:hypothetical protein
VNSDSHNSSEHVSIVEQIATNVVQAKRKLDAARAHGDMLQIDLAEAALNDLLERLSQVTTE